jgi:DNA-binding Lrp family transcriptional regulator
MVRKALILGEIDFSVTGVKIGETLKKISSIPGVKDTQYISGPYDLYLTVEVDDPEELSAIVSTLRKIEGIKETMTCLVLSPKRE